MTQSFAVKQARILLVEPGKVARQVLIEVLHELGCGEVQVVTSCREALDVLEVECFDWLITPLLVDDKVNAFELLKFFGEEETLQDMHISLLLQPGEENLLPYAFELGLLSYHPRVYIRNTILSVFGEFVSLAEAANGDAKLIAANYLTQCLFDLGATKPVLSLMHSLYDLYPGSSGFLFGLAKAKLLDGQTDDGLRTLSQSVILDPALQPQAQSLRKLIAARSKSPQASPGDSNQSAGNQSQEQELEPKNKLGIKTIVLIDPDSDVDHIVRKLMQPVGVESVMTFVDGRSALAWLESNPEPDLIIQEWRIPKLTGPLLIQRVRAMGRLKVPIVILSSLLRPADVSLVREMGVADVIHKPVDQGAFFKALIWVLQQKKVPTEQRSLERKIRALLQRGNLSEAQPFKLQYLEDARVSVGSRIQMEAEFAFAEQRYPEAKELCIVAIKNSGDSMVLVGLLGKTLLKLGDFAAGLKFLEKAQQLSPLSLERLCTIAEVQQEMGDQAAAVETLKKAQALDGDHPTVRGTEFTVAIGSNNMKRARDIIMQEVESMPRLVAHMNNHAVALILCGSFESGITLYRRTLEALPKGWSRLHGVVWYNLALALARAGELMEARSCLEPILSQPQDRLKAKAGSLDAKLNRALQSSGPLELASSSGSAKSATIPGQSSFDDEESLECVSGDEDSRGEWCCSKLFEAGESLRQGQNLIRKMPHFNKRTALASQYGNKASKKELT